MTVVRWSPIREMARLQHEVDRIFGATGTTLADWPRGDFFPKMDVVETSESYVLRADLPGLALEDIKVQLENNVLTIRGERSSTRHEEGTNVLHEERSYGSFERRFTLGTDVRSDNVTARYADGVLEVRVQKSDVQQAKEITIQR